MFPWWRRSRTRGAARRPGARRDPYSAASLGALSLRALATTNADGHGAGVRRDDTDWRYSSRANFAQEFGDLAAQLKTLRLQRLGGLPYVLRRSRSGIRVGFDPRDIFRDVPGALRGVLGAAGDFLGSGALLLDRGGDRGRDIVHLADDAANSLDGVDGVTGHLLDVGDLLGDIVGKKQ